MGADAMLVFYGVKIPLDPDDEAAQEACGDGSDPRCQAAQKVGLDSCNGRMTNGEDYFLYIGRQLGWLGLEHQSYQRLQPTALAKIIDEVDARLAQAGIGGNAALHWQLIAQY